MADVYWLSQVPFWCQFCSGITNGKPGTPLGDTFYDANITRYGFGWGIVCERCFNRYGNGLGTGRAQRYVKQPDGRYLKVAG